MSSKKKAQTPIDTTAGEQARALAVQYQAQLDPRLPPGTLAEFAADLATLGAPPAIPPPSQQPAIPAPPSLSETLAIAVNLVSALHDALRGAKATPGQRKAYGLGGKAPSKDANSVITTGHLLVKHATADATAALALGILPSDVEALAQAMSNLEAAKAAASAHAAASGVTAKEKHAAEARMHDAVGRIAGAGVLAFAQNAAVRAEFAALLPKKKA
jgi:hypothetical protein